MYVYPKNIIQASVCLATFANIYAPTTSSCAKSEHFGVTIRPFTAVEFLPTTLGICCRAISGPPRSIRCAVSASACCCWGDKKNGDPKKMFV